MPLTLQQLAPELMALAIYYDGIAITHQDGRAKEAAAIGSMLRQASVRLVRIDEAMASLTYQPGRQPADFDAVAAAGEAKANIQMLLDSLAEKEKQHNTLAAENAQLREAVRKWLDMRSSYDEFENMIVTPLYRIEAVNASNAALTTPATTEWLAAHNAEVRRAALEEAIKACAPSWPPGYVTAERLRELATAPTGKPSLQVDAGTKEGV